MKSLQRIVELESLLKHAKRLEEDPLKPWFVEVDPSLLITDNYRSRSEHDQDVKHISQSIEEYGQQQPGSVSIQPDRDWKLLDGESRLIGVSLSESHDLYKTMVYEGLTRMQEVTIQLAANAFKMPFAPWALSKAAYELYTLKNPGYREEKRFDGEALQEVADVLKRSPATVRKYLQFETLPSDIKKYVREDKNMEMFSRAALIAAKIDDPHEQQGIFYEVRRHLKEYNENQEKIRTLKQRISSASKKQRIRYTNAIADLSRTKAFNDRKFRHDLRKRNAQEEMLYVQKHTKSNKNLNHLLNSVKTADQYLQSLHAISSLAPGRFSDIISAQTRHPLNGHAGTLGGFIEKISTDLDSLLLGLSNEAQAQINELQISRDRFSSVRKNLHDMIVQRGYGEPSMLARDTVSLAPKNARGSFNQEQIRSLAENMTEFGQITPGLVHPNDDGWEIIFGNTRYISGGIAGLTHYKAFMLTERLSEEQILTLQLIEDIHKQDSLQDRAEGMHRKFLLRKEQEGKSYDLSEFIKEERRYADPSTIRSYMELANLDRHVKPFFKSGYLSGSKSLLINKALPMFEDDSQAEEFILRIIMRNPGINDLRKYIQTERDSQGNTRLFSDTQMHTCYRPLAVESLKKLYGPIEHLRRFDNPKEIRGATIKHLAHYKTHLNLINEELTHATKRSTQKRAV